MTRAPVEPKPLLPQPGYQLEPQEVRELWSFVHGDIMIGGLRDQLRTHLGLCDRHSWGHAVVEIELWQFGPGGHQPFDVAVLYTDLLEMVSDRLAAYSPSRRHRTGDVLGRHGTCRICDETTGDTANIIGYAGQDTTPLLAEANQMTYTRNWIIGSADRWRARCCPVCQPAVAPPPQLGADAATAPLCRSHLLEGGDLEASTARSYAEHLTRLAARLGRHLQSLSNSVTASSADDQTAWIETLGWFAGWVLPLTLAPVTVDTQPTQQTAQRTRLAARGTELG